MLARHSGKLQTLFGAKIAVFQAVPLNGYFTVQLTFSHLRAHKHVILNKKVRFSFFYRDYKGGVYKQTENRRQNKKASKHFCRLFLFRTKPTLLRNYETRGIRNAHASERIFFSSGFAIYLYTIRQKWVTLKYRNSLKFKKIFLAYPHFQDNLVVLWQSKPPLFCLLLCDCFLNHSKPPSSALK